MFGALEQELTLDRSQHEKGLREAERDMQDLGDTAESQGSRLAGLGEKMKGAGMAASMGLTAPLLAAGAMSVQTASDVEEMQSKMSVVFGDATDDIKAWAKAQEDATGVTELAWQEYATQLQDTFVPMGFAKDEAMDMSKQISSLAVDLASFNNMSTTEALDRLRGGLVGNHENLEAFGVMINQSMLDAKLQEMFGKGADAASEQEKALARLEITMEGTQAAQGDAERTADSFANTMKSLKGQLQEAAVMIGQELIPVLKPMVAALADGLEWFQGLSPEVKRFAIVVAGLLAAAGPLLLFFGVLLTLPITGTMLAVAGAFALVTGAVAALWPYLQPLVESLLPKLQALFTTLASVGQRVGEVIQGVVSGDISITEWLVGIVSDGITAVRNYITGIGKEDVRAAFYALGRAIRNVALTLFNGGGALLEYLKNGILAIDTYLREQAAEDLKGAAKAAFTALVNAGEAALAMLTPPDGIIARTIQSIVDYLLNDAWNDLKKAGEQVFDVIMAAAEGLYDGLIGNSLIPDMFRDIASWIKKTGARLVGDAFGAAARAAKRGFNSVLPDKLTIPKLRIGGGSFMGQKLPSTTIGGQSWNLPSLDTGGFVEDGGLAMIHAGEEVVPRADVSRRRRTGPATQDISIEMPITIEGNADQNTVEDIQRVVRRELDLMNRKLKRRQGRSATNL